MNTARRSVRNLSRVAIQFTGLTTNGCAGMAHYNRHAMESTGKRPYATLRWCGDALELIDQRVLPQTLTYVCCRDADEVAGAIRDMVVRGAPAIGCAAAYGVALEALRLSGRARA